MFKKSNFKKEHGKQKLDQIYRFGLQQIRMFLQKTLSSQAQIPDNFLLSAS